MSESINDWQKARDALQHESKTQRYISDRRAFQILAEIAERRSSNEEIPSTSGKGSNIDSALDIVAADQVAINRAQFEFHKSALATLTHVIKLQWLVITLLLIVLWRAW